MTDPYSYYFLLGSNLGDRAEQLISACEKIQQNVGDITKGSSIYKTVAWGKTQQPEFLNQAIRVDSSMEPTSVLPIIQSIEQEMGRKRLEKWAERIIDIDILYCDDLIVSLPNLTIPHLQIQHRRFALVPLAEIAPTFIHPILKKTNQELLTACLDCLPVQIFNDLPLH